MKPRFGAPEADTEMHFGEEQNSYVFQNMNLLYNGLPKRKTWAIITVITAKTVSDLWE